MSLAVEDSLSSTPLKPREATYKRYVVLLATSLDTMGGISAVIHSYRAAGLFDRWPVLHIPTHCDGSPWAKLKMAVAGHLRFWRLLMTRQIAVLHVHGASDASFWRKSSFTIIAILARVPIIYHLHGGGFIRFYQRRWGAVRRWLIRTIFDHSAALVVLSEEWRRRIQQLTRNHNIVVVANPIDPTLLQQPRPQHPDKVILFTGRLVEQKGVIELIDAFAQIAAQVPEWRLQFAGHGDIERLRVHAQMRGISDRVDFLGWISGRTKLERLRTAGVYVLPSWVEGLPMSLLEAMAVGLPVVATRVGAIPEVIVDESNGRLVEPRDVPALAAALLELIASEDERARMGLSARATVAAQFAPGEILPRVESLYAALGAHPRMRAGESVNRHQ